MELHQQAQYIFKKLNEHGAGLGNMSVPIIENALQEISQLTPVAADGTECQCVTPVIVAAICSCGGLVYTRR